MMGGERSSIDKYCEDLASYLVASCTDAGLLKAWQRYAPSFYGDAVGLFKDAKG